MTLPEQYRLTPLEVASGFVFGSVPDAPTLPERPQATPRDAFRASLVAPLRRAPCLVSFSGGRDSAGVLAAATDVARREGLALPIPATIRFPEEKAAEESDWQERLIAHLDLEEWIRIEMTDELDCVGPIARAALRRHGLIWPMNAHFMMPLLQAAVGGSLLTGVGGDQIFFPSRLARHRALLALRARPVPRDVLRLAFAASPRPLRRTALRGRELESLACPWLTREGQGQVLSAWREEAATEPISWAAAVRWNWSLRPQQANLAYLELLAAGEGALLVHPFLDPRFLAAMIEHRTYAALADRTEAMRMLFGDVVPDDVCARPTKASFDGVFWNHYSDEFADRFDGTGVDQMLVDVGALRSTWRSPGASNRSRSLTQMQAAWLAAEASGPGSALEDEQELLHSRPE